MTVPHAGAGVRDQSEMDNPSAAAEYIVHLSFECVDMDRSRRQRARSEFLIRDCKLFRDIKDAQHSRESDLLHVSVGPRGECVKTPQIRNKRHNI